MGAKEFFKNVFFDSFKGIDELVHPDEFSDTGKAGEQFCYRALWYYFKDNLFRNVYIRDANGKLHEIDLLGIGHKGIYVFESKNYSGHIYGNGKYKFWKCYLGKKSYSFYSPLEQNKTHITALQSCLTQDYPQIRFFNICIFSVRGTLSISNVGEGIIVKRDGSDESDLHKKMKLIIKSHDDILSDEEIEKLKIFFSLASRPSEEIKQEHLAQIQQDCHNHRRKEQ